MFLFSLTLIWSNGELATYLVDQDISNYIKKTGEHPSHEIYQELREKSANKRLAIKAFLILLIVLMNSMMFKFFKISSDETET